MTKEEIEVMRMALEALEYRGVGSWRKRQPAATAIKQVLANEALEKMAENARELGLDYEPDKNEFKPDWDEKLALTEEVIRLSKRIEELEAQPEPWEKFCDSNCVWTDHHPDCKLAEQEPVAWRAWVSKFPQGIGSDWVYVTKPIMKDRIHNQPLYTTPPQRKPLTDEEIWVLTSEYNDYDQHGEYFEVVFIGKPTSKQIQKHCHVTEQGAIHILNGGGRVKYEDQWYNLRKEKAAHGIKGEA